MPSKSKKPQAIGVLLKCARMKLKLSADEVGSRCNVSRSRVYQWEAETYVFPKNLPTLSAALHIPVSRLKAANRHPPGQ